MRVEQSIVIYKGPEKTREEYELNEYIQEHGGGCRNRLNATCLGHLCYEAEEKTA